MSARTTAIIAAVVFAAGLLVGAGAAVVIKNAKIDRIRAGYAAEREVLANQRTQLEAEARRRVEDAQRQVAAIDAKYTQERANDQTELEMLRGDLAAGNKRLRVAATCPASPRPAVPGAAAPARVDDGPAPRLDGSAESAYLDLRGRIKLADTQIRGLQDYIKASCQPAR